MSRISEKVRYVGVNDHDKILFEGLWPLPFGVTYNSYLVVDEKIALIDTVETEFSEEFIAGIKEEIGDRKIDYLVVNHMEPDHSSSIAAIRGIYPDITIISTALAVPMIKGYYGVEGNILTVKDGDTVSLGGSTLSFHATPMVHWPETMMTYLVEEKTIFSGDAFGSFGAVEGGIVDSEAGLSGWLGERKECFEAFRDEMTRYYSNIVGKYGAQVQAAFRKLSALEIKRICSTHGPVWESQAGKVVALYDSLSRYEAERGVCIVYGSMYGNTAQAALSLAAELAKKGVRYAIHDLCSEDMSFAYRDLFRYDTLAVGSPTYNNDIYPPVYSFMCGVCSRLVKNRRFIAFGSYTWAGASVRKLNEMAEKQSFQLLGEGLPFPHAFSKEKCDMAAIAALIAE